MAERVKVLGAYQVVRVSTDRELEEELKAIDEDAKKAEKKLTSGQSHSELVWMRQGIMPGHNGGFAILLQCAAMEPRQPSPLVGVQ